MFIVFDGIDGAGKSTQIEMFVDWLQSNDQTVVTCQDPGSTQLGEQIRALLLEKHQTPIHIRTEMMMFAAARTQLVQEIVKPALADGKTVVLDRYIYSSVVYQGHAGGLDPHEILTVNRIATEDVMPEVTFVLDLDVESALGRLGKDLDRMESRGVAYFEKVRAGFLAEAKRWPDRVEVIDASQSMDEMHTEIRRLAEGYFSQIENLKSEI